MWNGDALRALRQIKGFTIQKLADDLGVSRPYISQLELGQRVPSEVFLDKLAEYFKVKVDEFKKLRVIDGTIEHRPLAVNHNAISSALSQVSPGPEPKAQLDTSTTRLSVRVLIAMINRILGDIRLSVSNREDNFPTQVIVGLLLQSVTGRDYIGRFQLVASQEYLSLRVYPAAKTWSDSELLCEIGNGIDVALTAVGDSDEYSEYVWFTPYTSVSYRVRQCHMWAQQGRRLETRDETLAEYFICK